jgi:glutathione synthase/RimK-type ligase-like ATP-grasp enzyme
VAVPDVVDWRRGLPDGLRFTASTLGDETLERVVEVVDELGLQYAAVDLIETADGTVWFLEVNPSGAYLWLERQLGLPVTNALVELLLSA